jgi:hypothetical protein
MPASTGAARGILLAAALAFASPAQAASPGLARIHAIALAPIAEPAAYRIVSSATDAGQYDSRTFVTGGGKPAKPFAEAMAEQNLHLGAELFERLRQNLTRAGFALSAPAAAEAVLQVAFSPAEALYSDAALGDDLMPSFAVSVRLSDARTRNLITGETVYYGQGENGAAHTLYPDARYRFTSPDALIADPQAAAEGLRAGLPLIADEIAAALKP